MSRDYYNISPPEFLIENRVEHGNSVRYDLIPAQIVVECPSCHSTNFIKHGTSNRKVRDLSEFGKLVGLVIKVHRYICKDCGATWSDQFQSVEENAKMTNRMRIYIQDKSFREPFLRISNELDISVSTIKRIFSSYLESLDKKHILTAPNILGIDENYLNGKYRGIFVDIENGRVIDMTPDRLQETVERWLYRLPHKERIKCVTIDMYGHYKDALKAELPSVPIVIDKFHVVKNVNEALDKARKRLVGNMTSAQKKQYKNNRSLLLRNSSYLDYSGQMRLHALLESFPPFKEPYRLKEDFRDIYACKTREEAEGVYKKWKARAITYPEFEGLVATIEEWRLEIFNYFVFRYTNATTESLNRLVKEIAARGRGYNFGVLRAKVLYGTKATKPARYEYYPDESAENVDDTDKQNAIRSAERVQTYARLIAGAGVDIKELIEAVKSGEF